VNIPCKKILAKQQVKESANEFQAEEKLNRDNWDSVRGFLVFEGLLLVVVVGDEVASWENSCRFRFRPAGEVDMDDEVVDLWVERRVLDDEARPWELLPDKDGVDENVVPMLSVSTG
jgi:hypothetical protein